MLSQPIIIYLIVKIPTLAGLEPLLAAAVHHLVAEMLRGLAHLQAGLEKPGVFLKKPAQWDFLGFWAFLFFGFF